MTKTYTSLEIYEIPELNELITGYKTQIESFEKYHIFVERFIRNNMCSSYCINYMNIQEEIRDFLISLRSIVDFKIEEGTGSDIDDSISIDFNISKRDYCLNKKKIDTLIKDYGHYVYKNYWDCDEIFHFEL